MTTNDEQYVPDEQDLEVAWIESEASADDINVASAEFDRFLARVRRDAARGAIDGLIADRAHMAALLHAENGGNVEDVLAHYRDTHYPEETP